MWMAIAQRKEDRQAQVQLQYAQRMAGLAGPSTPVIPGGVLHSSCCCCTSKTVLDASAFGVLNGNNFFEKKIIKLV